MVETDEITYAAGGIVWKRVSGLPKIALTYDHRFGGHWRLPKGALLDDDSWKIAALREVEQEIGEEVQVLDHADTIHFMEKGQPQVVSYWHMKSLNGVSVEENGQHDIGWFTPKEAFQKVNYEAEQRVISRLAQPEPTKSVWSTKVSQFLQQLNRLTKILLKGKSRFDRLRGEIDTFRDEFNVRIQESKLDKSAEWVSQVLKMLHRADTELYRGNMDVAWNIFAGAKRIYLQGLSRSELKEEVKIIREEANQLSDWRRKAIQQLLGDREHPRKEFEITADLLVKAIKIRDEELLEAQFKSTLLRSVYMVLLPLLIILATLAWAHFQANNLYSFFGVESAGGVVQIDKLARLSWGIMLFGMLGACVSALFHAYDTAELTQEPGTLTHFMVTGTRVLIGGVLALMVFVFLQTEFISQIFTFTANPSDPFTYYTIAFLVGFSERLVLRSLKKASRSQRLTSHSI
jgi:8-oxo-dGTP diphosphatase